LIAVDGWTRRKADIEDDVTVDESSCLSDKMKVMFNRALAKPLEYMREVVAWDSALLGDLEKLLPHSLVGVSMKEGYVTDMEEKEYAFISLAKPLEYMREVVAWDSALLGDLEKLLPHSLVGVSMKEGYVTDMEEKEYAFISLGLLFHLS
nr:hypothetical protein [Tanacetum cinerariifolium]